MSTERPIKPTKPKFNTRMTRTQLTLGWIYLPMHLLVLPLLISLYAAFAPQTPSDTAINLAYFGLGVLFLLCVMLPYLRRSFDQLLDWPQVCLLTMLLAIPVLYALSSFASILYLLLGGLAENPNNEAIEALAGENAGITRGLSIFIAPVLEEVLYRGVAFGGLRNRSRGLAYVVSVVLFALSHVWQYALAALDPGLLLYAVQYVPVAITLAWLYERSGSIWTCIFFHMGYNALSFWLLEL